MKPVQKGIGIIAVATGATMLAITLLGCSKEEGKTDGAKTSSVESTETKSLDSGSSKSINAQQDAGTKTTPEFESRSTSVVPPPPGLFQDNVSKTTIGNNDVATPKAPEEPASPKMPAPLIQPEEPQLTQSVSEQIPAPVAPEKLADPVAPEAVSVDLSTRPQTPESPKIDRSNVKFEIPSAHPAKTADQTMPAKAAETKINIPPPPMPDINHLKAEPVMPIVSEQPMMKIPAAPILEIPKMQKPSANVTTSLPNTGSMQMPPAMNMPNMNMRMPSPNMNMNPNAVYAPRVFYVPMPMYPYGQPHPSYGYSVPNPPVQPEQNSQQKNGSN